MAGEHFTVEIVGVTNEFMFSSTLIMDLGTLTSLLSPFEDTQLEFEYYSANKLLLKVEDGFDVNLIQNSLNLDDRGVRFAFTKKIYNDRISALASSQAAIIYLMTFLGLIVGLVSVFTTMLISIVERERELAILRVIGLTRGELILQILLEGIIIGVLSVVSGIFLGQYVAENLWMEIVRDTLFDLTPYYSNSLITAFGIYALVSILASILPSFSSATSRKLSDVIREE